jgi:putative phage-type endonuclease
MSVSTKKYQQQPALRLISTKNLRHSDWLEVRKQGIGASDAAAAVGISPYQSQLDLWMIKTGRDQYLPKVDFEDMESPMYWGHVLEPIVAQQYTKKTGNKVRRVNAVLQHPDPDKYWMLANLDYCVANNEDVQILECKTAGEFGARMWRDGVPDYVQCQVQHQLAVTGKSAADVCVLICGQSLQVYRIKRDEAVISKIIALERRFWRYVENDIQPPADGSEAAGKALRALFPQDTGCVLDLREDHSMTEAFDRLVSLQGSINSLKKDESFLTQKIQETMRDASKAIFPNGEVSWKKAQDTCVLDTKKLLADKPELLKQYGQSRKGSRRFLIKTQSQ